MIRRLPRRLSALLVTAGLLALPASAGAANVDLPLLDDQDQELVSGPNALGDSLVWVVRRRGAIAVRQRTGSVTRTVLRVPASGHNTTEAYLMRADDRIGLRTYVSVPNGHASLTVAPRTWWAAPGAPFVEQGPCTVAMGDDYVQTGLGPYDLGAVTDCDDRALSGPGVASAISAAAAHAQAVITGGLAATIDEDHVIQVRERRTGTVLYTVPARTQLRYGLTLDRDGTVVFTDDGADGSQVMLATVADPVPRPAPVPYGQDPTTTRVVDGKIAWKLDYAAGVVSVDGTGATRTSSQTRGFAFDFDGRTLLWADRTCGVHHVVAWDVQGPPPPAPPDRCGVPRLRVPSIARVWGSVVAPSALKAVLRCPASREGCAGSIAWSTVTRIGRRDRTDRFATQLFRLRPGASATLSPQGRYRWTNGRPRAVRVALELDGTQRTKRVGATIAVRRR